MQILRVFVAVCLAAMGVAMLCVALLSALDAAVILSSYDKVEGVVTGAGNTEVRVDYVRPDGRRAVLYARSGGKFDARPVGKKVAVLLPPKDRLDGSLKPILKDDLNPVAMEFMFAVLFLVGALVIWEGRSGGASSQSSEDLRTRGVDTHSKEPERPVRPQASIDFEHASANTREMDLTQLARLQALIDREYTSVDTRQRELDRQARLQASIDLEIAERRAKKDAR
ncbi:hypothetical protein [Variovorax boronicumulans]|uniref:hypothetical protein n=1 Tax=Variovorax boronicumulans TaxID=436515 RepID=UPI000780F3FD|nr:hypothetical protein [Variovorax boronicumulans]